MTNGERFARDIQVHAARMVAGQRQRYDAGEMPEHTRCDSCGDIILASLLGQHKANGLAHLN